MKPFHKHKPTSVTLSSSHAAYGTARLSHLICWEPWDNVTCYITCHLKGHFSSLHPHTMEASPLWGYTQHAANSVYLKLVHIQSKKVNWLEDDDRATSCSHLWKDFSSLVQIVLPPALFVSQCECRLQPPRLLLSTETMVTCKKCKTIIWNIAS